MASVCCVIISTQHTIAIGKVAELQQFFFSSSMRLRPWHQSMVPTQPFSSRLSCSRHVVACLLVSFAALDPSCGSCRRISGLGDGFSFAWTSIASGCFLLVTFCLGLRYGQLLEEPVEQRIQARTRRRKRRRGKRKEEGIRRERGEHEERMRRVSEGADGVRERTENGWWSLSTGMTWH